MRQRGAGVRVINPVFGFTFAFGTSPANEACPSEEYLQKYRNTADESTGLSDCALDTVKNIQAEAFSEKKSVTRAKKTRRRLPIDESPRHACISEQDREDSFVAYAKTMKNWTKYKLDDSFVIKAVDSGMSLEGAATLSKSRPKRRAATQATTKITKETAEEVVPVVERCGLEISRNHIHRSLKTDLGEHFMDMTPSGSRLKQAYASERNVKQVAPGNENEESSQQTASEKCKGGNRKRNGFNAANHPIAVPFESGHEVIKILKRQEEFESDQNQQHQEIARHTGKRKTKIMRRENVCGSKRYKCDPDLETHANGLAFLPKVDEPTATFNKNAKNISTNQLFDSPKRRPLEAADANTPRKSNLSKKETKLTEDLAYSETPKTLHRMTEGDREEDDSRDTHRETHSNCLEIDSKRPKQVLRNALREKISHDVVGRHNTRTNSSRAAKKKQGSIGIYGVSSEQMSNGVNTCASDPSSEADNLDWLLTSQGFGSHSSIKVAEKPALTSRMRTRNNWSRLPDIDLDDLVANIASFASVPHEIADMDKRVCLLRQEPHGVRTAYRR